MRAWPALTLALLSIAVPARAEGDTAAAATLQSAPATPTPTPTPEPPRPSNRLALQTEAAFGVSGSFYNHLVGARYDRCPTPLTCFGGYFAYANLKGQSGRANNVLLYAMVEHRRPLGAAWYVPMRIAAGYLPNNGPFLRLSAGLSVPVGKVDLTFDLLTPTVWVTRNDPVVSMDVAAEAALRF